MFVDKKPAKVISNATQHFVSRWKKLGPSWQPFAALDAHFPRCVLFNEVSKQCYKRYIQHKYRIYVSIVEKNMDNYELRKVEQ